MKSLKLQTELRADHLPFIYPHQVVVVILPSRKQQPGPAVQQHRWIPLQIAEVQYSGYPIISRKKIST